MAPKRKIPRPQKVEEDFAVPRPVAEGVDPVEAFASGMGPSTKVTLPGAAGFTRPQLDSDLPLTTKDLFFDAASGQTDPMAIRRALAPESSVTLQDADIARVNAARQPKPRFSLADAAIALGTPARGVPRPPVAPPSGAQATSAAPRASAPVADVPRPDPSINPLGIKLDPREEFERRKVVRNPNAFAPAERNRVLGQIAAERQQGRRAEQAQADADAQKQAFEQQKALIEAEAGAKGAQTRQTKELELDLDKQLADHKANIAKDDREAAFENEKAIAKIRHDNEVEKLDLQGEVVGSDAYIQKMQDATNQAAEQLAKDLEIDVAEAKTRFVGNVFNDTYQKLQGLDINQTKSSEDLVKEANAITQKIVAGAEALSPEVPDVTPEAGTTPPVQAEAEVDFDGNPNVRSQAEQDYIDVTTELQGLDPKDPNNAFRIRELKEMQTQIWNAAQEQKQAQQG